MLAYKLQSKEIDDLRERAKVIGEADNIALVGGRAAASLTREHLFALDSRANKLGGERSHFYSAAAQSVSQVQERDSAAFFTINKLGLAQRWLGGTITAGSGTSSATGGPTKYLAIPARAEAYNKTPKDFVDLNFVPTRGGNAMLVQALQTGVSVGKKGVIHGTTKGGLVMFWLVKSVTQEADPTVMPTEKELTSAAAESMSNYLARRLAS